MRILRHVALIITSYILIFSILAINNSVYASFATYECTKKNTQLNPYINLVLVDLSEDIENIDDINDFYKEVFYEFMYVNKAKSVPFNAIFYDGKLYYFGCEMVDSKVSNLKNVPDNSMVVALLNRDDLSILHIQSLIDKYYFSKIYISKIHQVDDTFTLTDTKVYKDDKLKLYKDPLAYRDYSLNVEVKYAGKIDPQTEGVVRLIVRNDGNDPIPSKNFKPLVVKSLSKAGISDLYNKEWIGLKEVLILNDDYIWPGDTIDVTFKVGPYLLPIEHKDSFAIFLKDKRIKSSEFSVNLQVKDRGLHIVKIVPNGYKFANVHKTPGLNSPVVFKLDPNEYVVYLKKDGAWVYIETVDRRKGWVYYPFVKEL